MFGSVHQTIKKPLKKAVFGFGTSFAKEQDMKQGFSSKQLTLVAGIVVALIVAFMIASASADFSASAPKVELPPIKTPAVAKVILQKIIQHF